MNKASRQAHLHMSIGEAMFSFLLEKYLTMSSLSCICICLTLYEISKLSSKVFAPSHTPPVTRARPPVLHLP